MAIDNMVAASGRMRGEAATVNIADLIAAIAAQVADINESTALTHSTVTVGVTTGAVLAANTNRKYAILINDSDTAIYINIGAAAVLNTGIRIEANGGSYELSARNGNLSSAAINAISAAGSKILLVTEG